MAFEFPEIFDFPFVAEADESANQFKFMKPSTSTTYGNMQGGVVIPSAATDHVVGILQNNNATAGSAANVRMLGFSKLKVDGSGTAIAFGDFLGTNSTGFGVKKATNDYTIAAMALAPSSASTDIIPVFVFPAGFFRSAAG